MPTAISRPQLYDPRTNAWQATGTLTAKRSEPSATRLLDGSVLLVGGAANSGPTFLNTVERYDPSSGTWNAEPSMAHAHYVHTATLLDEGQVLVAGGFDGGAFVSNADLYLPSQSELGEDCTVGVQCHSGFCADGVCCDSACTAGTCDACTVAGGAEVDGSCALLTGPSCDDRDACTQGDSCVAGACRGGVSVSCEPPTPCFGSAHCDPETGECHALPEPEGSACSEGTCSEGQCVPSSETGAGGEGGRGAFEGGRGGEGGRGAFEGGRGGEGGRGEDASGGDAPGGDVGDDAPVRGDGDCGCTVVGGSTANAGWLMLGLLFHRLRCRRRHRARSADPRRGSA